MITNKIADIDTPQIMIEIKHDVIAEVINQYVTGLITDEELCDTMREIANLYVIPLAKLAGQLDLNTGLRYPKDIK
jgi:outer membrane receptor for monomeric catechols